MKTSSLSWLALGTAFALAPATVKADNEKGELGTCQDLPSQAQLQAALKSVVDVGGTNNSGFGLNMWATTVDRDGLVCAVAFSGTNRGDQWPGSRVISAQKANHGECF